MMFPTEQGAVLPVNIAYSNPPSNNILPRNRPRCPCVEPWRHRKWKFVPGSSFIGAEASRLELCTAPRIRNDLEIEK